MIDLTAAVLIAEQAHAGQTDKAGQPYINHPMRVASRLETARERIVAVLHDVVEDTSVTLQELQARGLERDLVDALDAITHRPNERHRDYLARVVANPIACAVKIEDMLDNVERLHQIDDVATRERLGKKYARGLRVLISSALAMLVLALVAFPRAVHADYLMLSQEAGHGENLCAVANAHAPAVPQSHQDTLYHATPDDMEAVRLACRPTVVRAASEAQVTEYLATISPTHHVWVFRIDAGENLAVQSEVPTPPVLRWGLRTDGCRRMQATLICTEGDSTTGRPGTVR